MSKVKHLLHYRQFTMITYCTVCFVWLFENMFHLDIGFILPHIKRRWFCLRCNILRHANTCTQEKGLFLYYINVTISGHNLSGITSHNAMQNGQIATNPNMYLRFLFCFFYTGTIRILLVSKFRTFKIVPTQI